MTKQTKTSRKTSSETVSICYSVCRSCHKVPFGENIDLQGNQLQRFYKSFVLWLQVLFQMWLWMWIYALT